MPLYRTALTEDYENITVLSRNRNLTRDTEEANYLPNSALILALLVVMITYNK